MCGTDYSILSSTVSDLISGSRPLVARAATGVAGGGPGRDPRPATPIEPSLRGSTTSSSTTYSYSKYCLWPRASRFVFASYTVWREQHVTYTGLTPHCGDMQDAQRSEPPLRSGDSRQRQRHRSTRLPSVLAHASRQPTRKPPALAPLALHQCHHGYQHCHSRFYRQTPALQWPLQWPLQGPLRASVQYGGLLQTTHPLHNPLQTRYRPGATDLALQGPLQTHRRPATDTLQTRYIPATLSLAIAQKPHKPVLRENSSYATERIHS